MTNILFSKLKEAALSVLPIIAVILFIDLVLIPMPSLYIFKFLLGSLSLVIGMTLFSIGADIALMPMGQRIGSSLIKSKKVLLILGISFLIGIIITIAEPDLIVLSKQVTAVSSATFVIIVAVGVGIFLLLAMLRILYQIKITYVLIFFYGLILILMLIVPSSFISLAFDAGGVTTGPISVPLIIALGLGFTRIRGDKRAKEDSFGIISLCSIGPVLIVLLMGLFIKDGGSTSDTFILLDQPVLTTYLQALFSYGKSIMLVLLPIVIFFAVYQIFFIKMKKRKIGKIIKGLIYTYIGLVLFLAGADMGYLPMGYLMGKMLAALNYYWIIIPVGIIIGYTLIVTEPAVQVLTDQIDKITQGNISKKVMIASLSLSVALAVGLSMLRILVGLPIISILWGGYVIVLVLTFFVPSIFTTIAFDSGGVAAGTMAATFLLPFAVGACETLGRNPATDAFGVIALTALAPIVTIQLLGLVYKHRLKTAKKSAMIEVTDTIVDYQALEEGGNYNEQ